MSAPFRVARTAGLEGLWSLYSQANPHQPRHIAYFHTQGEAIDYAYKHWPWWL